MIGNSKRSRAKNFTMGEELILEYLILQHKDVISTQKSGADVWRRKKDAWKQIAADFAVQSGIGRPWQALREKHINSQRLKRLKMPMKRKTTGCPFQQSHRSVELLNVKKGSTDFDPEYEHQNTLSNTSSEPQFEQDNSNHSISKINVRSVHELRKEEASNDLIDEKLNLLKAQQAYYRNQNSRAAEQHEVEMELQRTELEQRKIELERYKLELERYQVELQGTRLKNQLLEMEILERQGRIKESDGTS
ncbi:myb/SANT-like DNA-binding domain-containing protein 4 [Drosophila rhopaloa]|uniref:Regulatory protein zeste n=1 Tax=Drosophila rhopaloa TaxID=1041015 RepID=A0ABM5J950_DRORH|nr:myb/SANT-like DNA-binding domain-containing protein 4 [Drosophila rhopaloa]